MLNARGLFFPPLPSCLLHLLASHPLPWVPFWLTPALCAFSYPRWRPHLANEGLFSARAPQNTPALQAMFSRDWHRLHLFPRLAPGTCFPALGTGSMFSRAWHRFHVFPRLAPVTYFPAFGTGSMFSRAWHRLNDFQRLVPACFAVHLYMSENGRKRYFRWLVLHHRRHRFRKPPFLIIGWTEGKIIYEIPSSKKTKTKLYTRGWGLKEDNTCSKLRVVLLFTQGIIKREVHVDTRERRLPRARTGCVSGKMKRGTTILSMHPRVTYPHDFSRAHACSPRSSISEQNTGKRNFSKTMTPSFSKSITLGFFNFFY